MEMQSDISTSRNMRTFDQVQGKASFPIMVDRCRAVSTTGVSLRSVGGCSLQIIGFCCSQESSSSTLVEHPCYPKDYKETISLSSFRTSPCTNQSDPRLPLDDRNVTLEGRSNSSGCLVAIKKLFNFSACGQSQDCSFDGIYQPPVSGQFFVRQTPSSFPQLCVSPWCCGVLLSPVPLSPPCSRAGEAAPILPVPQGAPEVPGCSQNGTLLIKQMLSETPSHHLFCDRDSVTGVG